MTRQSQRNLLRAYLSAEPNPQAYRAFVTETLAQATRYLGGLHVAQVRNTEPYPDSRAMLRDIEHGRLLVSSVDDTLERNHPLLQRVNAFGQTMSANVLFRVVHDALAHYEAGAEFETVRGELAAYQAHARKYADPWAQAVLLGETNGQLAYYAEYEDFMTLQRAVVIR